MEGSTSQKNDNDKTEPSQESLIGANWPSLPVPADSPRTIQDTTQDSPIQPAQNSPTPWKGQQRGPADYERDRVEKYAKYFKGNEILPIPELVGKLTPRILSLVVSDLKTKRLVGLKKETFEELLRKAGIPCQYFCRKSFATWDVLLPTEDQAAKLAANNITTKYFRLQPEYRGTRRLRVTVCNVPASITGEVLAAYLSSYGQVEEFNLLRSPAGTAYGDYAFRLCLTKDGFKAIPETLISGDRQMIVMVEGRRPRCWSCKQIGHISKFCPEKPENTTTAAATTAATTTASKTATTTTISKTAAAQDPGQAQPKTSDQEGWSEVTRKRRGSPKEGEKSPNASPPQKQTKSPEPAAATVEQSTTTSSTPTTQKGPQTPTTAKTTATSTTPISPVSPTLAKKKKKKTNNKEDHENMETSTNLKRRRDSGKGAARKVCAGPSCTEDPLEGPSNAYPQKPPLPQQVPIQVPLLVPFPPLSLPPPPLPLPPMFPPQYCIPQNAPPEPLQPPQYLQPPLPPPQPPQPPLPTETPPFHPQFEKIRPHQIGHVRRAQSVERQSPQNIIRTLSLPSLSPFSSPELFSERTPIQTDPRPHIHTSQKGGKQCRTRKNSTIQCKTIMRHQCRSSNGPSIKKMLKPLLQLEKIEKKKVNNPLNFKSAAMVTNFIRSAGDRTKGVWKFLDTVRQTDTGVKLAELEHSSLKRCLPFCSGRVPILVHPSFYRALKIRFPLDVGGVSRDGRVNTELSTGSLRQAVGILTPGDFRPIVDTE